MGVNGVDGIDNYQDNIIGQTTGQIINEENGPDEIDSIGETSRVLDHSEPHRYRSSSALNLNHPNVTLPEPGPPKGYEYT